MIKYREKKKAQQAAN